MIADYLRRQPRILMVLAAVLCVAGGSSYWVLPRLEDPILGKRIGIITTAFPGADARRVDGLVSRTISAGLASLSDIETVRTTSRAGISAVVIELRDQVTDFDGAWNRVLARLEQLAPNLPAESLPPQLERPALKAFAAIVALTWHSEEPPPHVPLSRLASELAARIERLPGTEQARIYGAAQEEIHVALDSATIARTSLSPAAIAQQVAGWVSQHPAGVLRGETSLLADLSRVGEGLDFLAELPVRLPATGGTAPLGTLGAITSGPRTPHVPRAEIDGRVGVAVCAFVHDEVRVDHWTTSLQSELTRFASLLPAEIRLEPVFLQTDYIESRIGSLQRNLLFTSVAVIGVVLMMMGWRHCLVVWSALPLSALLVLSGMRVLGIPIHQMSVTSLVIALGLLIDNAIIMVEQVRSSRLAGADPAEAVSGSVRRMAIPLFGSTLTTTLAFVPLAILPGAPGEFVGTLAIGVILAVNASYLLSMTMIPALAGLLRADPTASSMLDGGLNSPPLQRFYEYTLRVTYRTPLLGILLGMLAPLLGFAVARTLPEQFFPPSDRTQIQLEIELPAASEIEDTAATAASMGEYLRSVPEIEQVHWFLGESAPTFFYNLVPRRRAAPFYGQALINLAPGTASGPLVRRLQSELDRRFVSCRSVVRQLEQGPPFDAPLEIQVQGPDLSELQSLGSKLRLTLAQTKHVIHTRSDLEETVPKLAMRLDEAKAHAANLNREEIARQVYAALNGISAGQVTLGGLELPIRVSLASDDPITLATLGGLELPTRPLETPQSLRSRGLERAPRGEGAMPLAAVVQFELDAEVGAITRVDGMPTNEVKGYIAAGVLPASVLEEFQRRLGESGFELPRGYALHYGGEASERNEAVRNLQANAAVLVALMALTLVLSFQSIRCAAIVCAVGGLAIGLGVGALWLFGFPFGFMGIVGAMGLVGVAINDSIVVLAALRAAPWPAEGTVEHLVETVSHNTRHVLTTTLTTITGFVPLIWLGGEFWPPLAIAIAGGVGGATLLALYFVPSLYLLVGLGVRGHHIVQT